MQTYADLYEEGLDHLEHWSREIYYKIKTYQSVCITAIPRLGINRVIDYVAYKANDLESTNVIHSSSITDKFQDLADSIRNDVFNVFIISKYIDRKLSFRKKFSQLIQTNKRNTCCVVSLDPDVFVDTEKTIFGNTAMLTNLIILKPLNLELSKSVIESRIKLNELSIPEEVFEEIYELTGGHAGLIKHTCIFYDKKENLIINNLLNYPTIKIICKNIKTAFSDLDEAYLSKFGLTNQKGEFMSKLISNYWDSNQENIITNLSDKQKELFELFIKNEEQIVQKSEIEDIISSSKNYSLWGFYKYLSRFREEIKPDYELLNVYGKGYYIRRRK